MNSRPIACEAIALPLSYAPCMALLKNISIYKYQSSTKRTYVSTIHFHHIKICFFFINFIRQSLFYYNAELENNQTLRKNNKKLLKMSICSVDPSPSLSLSLSLHLIVDPMMRTMNCLMMTIENLHDQIASKEILIKIMADKKTR